MAKYRGVARDEFGNALSGASVTVYDFDTTDEATIYSDVDLATTQANPITLDADGVFVFYIAPGVYDIQVAKSGYTTTTLEDEQIGAIEAMCAIAMTTEMTIDNSYSNVINDTTSGAGSITLQHGPAFSLDADTGILTYNGNAKIKAEIQIGGRLYAVPVFAGNNIFMVCQINGSGAEFSVQRYVPDEGTDDAQVYHGVKVLDLENGDNIRIPIFSAGAPFTDVIVRDGWLKVRSLG